VRTAYDRKPYCSRKGMPEEKEKAKAGRVGKVMRVMRIRIARANQRVSIAIRKGIRCGTARA